MGIKSLHFVLNFLFHIEGLVCPQKRGLNGNRKMLGWFQKYSILCELKAIIRELVFVPPVKYILFAKKG